ncbi:ribonuclease H-like protein [Exidia glandulosa HHB12029]|uniref:Ribonuclease H-like protein n=1 Tax=Exidia glandulosa HHB12029 TaxID=1314781 RepID=A0A165F3E1_EXIGL|nr:ribonuclease H-like protein [Exidia glandulosa HHB12029]
MEVTPTPSRTATPTRTETRPDNTAASIEVDYTYVTNEYVLEDAVRALKDASHIFLDCEGHNLGAVGGSLSLVNLAAADGPVYVVDVLAPAFNCDEGREVLDVMFDVLKDAAVKKVMFDGRMDASEFMHGYGVEMSGVLDLQLADIVSRGLRGERQKQQIGRLVPFIHRKDVNGHWADYDGVHRLNGLIKAMGEHKLPHVRRTEAYHERWHARPLGEEMIAAAARDVHYVRTMWKHFVAQDWVREEELEAQSGRYAGLVRAMRPFSHDTFRCNGLLPQGILEDLAGERWTCTLCERELARGYFLRIALFNEGRRFCKTCRAVRMRKMRQEQRACGKEQDIGQVRDRDACGILSADEWQVPVRGRGEAASERSEGAYSERETQTGVNYL